MKIILKSLSYLKYLNFGKYLNWNKLFSNIFGAHSPDADTKILEAEESYGVRYAIVIRKSLWFSVFKSFEVLISLLLFGINIILLGKLGLGDVAQNFIIFVLGFNIFYGGYSFITYLVHFKRLNKEVPKVDSIYTWHQRSDKGDEYYNEFFNQTVTNIFIFFLISIYILISLLIPGNIEIDNIAWAGINVLILIIQSFLLFKIKVKINNQEMDFCIITPNKLYLYGQKGYTNQDNNEFPITKVRNVKGTYGSSTGVGSLLGSVLKYGTLQFLLDGGGSVLNESTSIPQFEYTPRMEETKSQVSLFIDKSETENGNSDYKYKQVVKDIPVILTQILFNLNINIDKNLKSVQQDNLYFKEIQKYLLNSNHNCLIEYKNGNSDIKNEIEELGKKYLNKEIIEK